MGRAFGLLKVYRWIGSEGDCGRCVGRRGNKEQEGSLLINISNY